MKTLRYKIVMLLTEEPTFPCICESTHYLRGETIGNKDFELVDSLIRGHANYYHLYVVDTEAEVQINNWAYNTEQSFVAKVIQDHDTTNWFCDRLEDTPFSGHKKDWCKIIASTNPSLEVKLLPQDFIKDYINSPFEYVDESKWIMSADRLEEITDEMLNQDKQSQECKKCTKCDINSCKKEDSFREDAIEWWDDLEHITTLQQALCDKYFYTRDKESLTGREIESIFNRKKTIKKTEEFEERYSSNKRQSFTTYLEANQGSVIRGSFIAKKLMTILTNAYQLGINEVILPISTFRNLIRSISNPTPNATHIVFSREPQVLSAWSWRPIWKDITKK